MCLFFCSLASDVSALLKVGQAIPQLLALPWGSPLQGSEKGRYHLPQRLSLTRRVGALLADAGVERGMSKQEKGIFEGRWGKK